MLGFVREEHKLGAIQVKFENGLKGWFKPCGLHNEYPENEVISSEIEYLLGIYYITKRFNITIILLKIVNNLLKLGFHRAPPSVMRNMTVESLLSLVEKDSMFYPLDQKYYFLDQTYATCSENGMLRGALTGW